MAEPVTSEASPEKRSLLAILLGVVMSRDFALRLMIATVGALALGWLGPKWAFAGLVLSQLLADTIKEFVTSRNWSVRRLWYVTALAVLFDRMRHRITSAHGKSVAVPLISTVTATVVVVCALTGVESARGQSLVGQGGTTFFGGEHRAAAPSLRLPDGRVVTSAAHLKFRDVQVGDSSTPESLILSSGSRGLRKLQVHAKPAAFHVASRCRRDLLARSTCRVQVVFQPRYPGHIKGHLVISFVNDPELTLSLAGTAVKAVRAAFSPPSLSFGPTTIGSTASAKTITLSVGSLQLLSPKVTTGSSEFTVMRNGCKRPQPAHNKCQIRIVFSPVKLGTRRATLKVTGGNDRPPLKASLTGSGVPTPPTTSTTTQSTPPTLKPASFNFKRVNVGSLQPPAVTFTLSAGSNALPIAKIVTTGTGYSITKNNCPAKLPAGQNCKIRVTFNPLGQGKLPGALVVRRSDGAPELSAPLNGIAVPTEAALTPPDHDFGKAQVSTNLPTTFDFTLDPGSSGFPYGRAYTKSKDFQVTKQCNTGMLTSPCTITVEFDPVVLGKRSASLYVTRTNGGPMLTASLTGFGS